MEQKAKEIVLNPEVIVELGIAVLAVGAGIGGAGIAGGLLGAANIPVKAGGGLMKICLPLGIAGLSAAAGHAASEGVDRTCHNAVRTYKVATKFIQNGIRVEQDEQKTETESNEE